MIIHIVEPDERQRAVLIRALGEAGFDYCHVRADHPPPDDAGGVEEPVIYLGGGMVGAQNADPIIIEKPYRFGALLDRVRQLRNRARQKGYTFPACRIDAQHSLFFSGLAQAGVRLTEKELDILLYLAARKGEAPVKRQDLLEAVWGYGENIETHTLETHIYRLRQKIEADPARPQFLQTRGDGYVLAGD